MDMDKKALVLLAVLILLCSIPIVQIASGAVILYLSLRGMLWRSEKLLGQRSAVFKLLLWIAMVILAFSGFAIPMLMAAAVYYAYIGLKSK